MQEPVKPPRAAEEEDDKRSRGDPLDMRLLESRIILVEGAVNDRMYRQVWTRLLFLEQKDPAAEVTVFINSPGGSADGGFAIYNGMRFVACPMRAICAGLCASSAVLILLGAPKGRRFALPDSRFLLHQPSTATFGPASDMEITAREILRTRKRYAEIVAREVGSTPEKVMDQSNRDFWLDAPEAVQYGLVDRIVTRRAEL
jgi:ATP-dependent Clp protease protease subunit